MHCCRLWVDALINPTALAPLLDDDKEIVVYCSVVEAVPVYDQSHPQQRASVPVVPVHFSMTSIDCH